MVSFYGLAPEPSAKYPNWYPESRIKHQVPTEPSTQSLATSTQPLPQHPHHFTKIILREVAFPYESD